ncbi:MAG: signal peptidase I [Alphaproteobacteria bacterium 41-28]|nr:MAG: signal peptidase I [Alphaproteobacteria bacterium 41-28]
MKEGLNTLMLLVCVVAILGYAVTRTRLYECGSESLQGIKYVLAVNRLSLKRGDIISLSGHDTAYVRGQTLVKKLMGLPGDVIEQTKMGIQVSQSLPGFPKAKVPLSSSLPLLKQTKDGKPLTPLTAARIPPGYVFVAGDHPRSFDSRYEEFGLVPIERIWGKAVAVFSTQCPVFSVQYSDGFLNLEIEKPEARNDILALHFSFSENLLLHPKHRPNGHSPSEH